MGCTAEIIYNKRAYSSGETLSGFILLCVSGSLLVESITLVVDKESGVQIEEVEERKESSTVNERAIRHLGKFFIYRESKRKLDSGVYKFPFRFRVGPEEGASIDYKKSFDSKRVSVLNKYISRCEVRIYGIFRPVSQCKKEILLVEEAARPVKKRTQHLGTRGCICLRASLTIHIEIDSVIYADKKNELKVLAEDKSISKVDAKLKMSIRTSSSLFTLLVPCTVTREKSSFFLSLDSSVPSETVRNELFSISYIMLFSVTLKTREIIKVERSVSVHGERVCLLYTPPDILGSILHPEKHLSLC